MLGPFRVRGAGSPVHPGTPVHWRRHRHIDALLTIDGDRYDRLIKSAPNAKLQYIDADSDIITIGSKHELADRLMDPVPRFALLPNHSSTLAVSPTAAHPFTFAPDQEALSEWKKIEAELRLEANAMSSLEDAESTQERVVQPQAPEPPPKIPQSPELLTSSSKGKEPEPLANSLPTGNPTFEKVQPPSPPSQPQMDMADMREVHFRQSKPPSTSEPAKKWSPTGTTASHIRPTTSALPAEQGVLSPQAIEQVREEAEKLRTGLGQLAASPNFYASTTSRPDNRWASYSHPSMSLNPPQLSASARSSSPLPEPAARFNEDQVGTKVAAVCEVTKAMCAEMAQARFEFPGTEQDAASSQAGALSPAYVENLQSRLRKLAETSPTNNNSNTYASDNESRPVVTENRPEPIPSYTCSAPTNAPLVDLREPLEIMVSKMVAQSIESVSSEFASLGSRLKLLVLPKIPEEAFKLKGYPDPEQLKEMWRDLEETKRALQTFGPDIDFAGRIVQETDRSSMFPSGSGMIDRKAMRAYSTSLKKMASAVDQLVDSVLKTAVPVEGCNAAKTYPHASYVIPKRLTAFNYEDIWSITLGNLDRDASEDHVRHLVWQARSSVGLPTATCKIETVTMTRYVSGSQAEIEIPGKQQAMETFNAMLMAESDPSYPQPLHLKRKLYPKVFQYQRRETVASQAAQPGASDSRQSDSLNLATPEAKLKSIQDRRAAWRREYKARAASVRFREPVAETVEPKDSNTLLDSPVPALQAAPSLKPSLMPRVIAQAKEFQPRSHTEKKSDPRAPVNQAEGKQIRPAASMAQLSRAASLPSTAVKPKRSLPVMRPTPFTMWHEAALKPGTQIQTRVKDLTELQTAAREISRGAGPSEEFNRRPPPGAWPDEPASRESSGAFARRMMGRSPAVSDQISPQSSPALKPARRTATRPVSAIDFLSGSGPIVPDFSATQLGSDAVDRNSKSAGGPWSRRPYSVTFDGSGRVDRERSRRSQNHDESLPARQTVEPPPVSHPDSLVGGSSAPPAPPVNREEEGQIERCVDSLVEMGFGVRSNPVRMDRLWMYARTADGKLDEAIDMIEEEREAWEEQTRF